MAAEDSWEQLKLEELSIKDASTPLAPESQQQQLLQQQQEQQQQVPVSQEQNAYAAELHLASPEEQAVLYALAGQHERMQALRIEEDVLAFIGDTNRDVLEFPPSSGNYQRLLAHKVAQYHGLQTSTADYEGSTGRVVAHRKCVETKVRSVGR
ncbi:hypothetical protein DUNSADRAFT_11269 [Dunaliella salina]|uniref:R3H domain-containing protein n=1 Tax=Dunaliella salina TaxID=3046 RepID=A0ABQ7GDS4_DUNSA|nr:hypothetical protein DUNSADRAFT_11269 [Dunaliella salina]|eukprot:KAF5832750.1 hypothetical protein DUNSADRAFT_11269 [Dunaliella salina]